MCFGYAALVGHKPRDRYDFLESSATAPPIRSRSRPPSRGSTSASARASWPPKTIMLGVLDLGDPEVETPGAGGGADPRRARPRSRRAAGARPGLRDEVPPARAGVRKAAGPERRRGDRQRRAVTPGPWAAGAFTPWSACGRPTASQAPRSRAAPRTRPASDDRMLQRPGGVRGGSPSGCRTASGSPRRQALIGLYSATSRSTAGQAADRHERAGDEGQREDHQKTIPWTASGERAITPSQRAEPEHREREQQQQREAGERVRRVAVDPPADDQAADGEHRDRQHRGAPARRSGGRAGRPSGPSAASGSGRRCPR